MSLTALILASAVVYVWTAGTGGWWVFPSQNFYNALDGSKEGGLSFLASLAILAAACAAGLTFAVIVWKQL